MNDIIIEYVKTFKKMPPMDMTLGYDDKEYLAILSNCVRKNKSLTNEEFDQWRSGILADLIDKDDFEAKSPEREFKNEAKGE